jgi:hypothetical protein
VPQYIEWLIKKKTREFLDEAEPLAAGKPEVLLRISEARETLKHPDWHPEQLDAGVRRIFRYART